MEQVGMEEERRHEGQADRPRSGGLVDQAEVGRRGVAPADRLGIEREGAGDVDIVGDLVGGRGERDEERLRSDLFHAEANDVAQNQQECYPRSSRGGRLVPQGEDHPCLPPG